MPSPAPAALSTSDDLLICKACGTQYDVKEGNGKDECRVCDVCTDISTRAFIVYSVGIYSLAMYVFGGVSVRLFVRSFVRLADAGTRRLA
jgi:hypothetical protein